MEERNEIDMDYPVHKFCVSRTVHHTSMEWASYSMYTYGVAMFRFGYYTLSNFAGRGFRIYMPEILAKQGISAPETLLPLIRLSKVFLLCKIILPSSARLAVIPLLTIQPWWHSVMLNILDAFQHFPPFPCCCKWQWTLLRPVSGSVSSWVISWLHESSAENRTYFASDGAFNLATDNIAKYTVIAIQGQPTDVELPHQTPLSRTITSTPEPLSHSNRTSWSEFTSVVGSQPTRRTPSGHGFPPNKNSTSADRTCGKSHTLVHKTRTVICKHHRLFRQSHTCSYSCMWRIQQQQCYDHCRWPGGQGFLWDSGWGEHFYVNNFFISPFYIHIIVATYMFEILEGQQEDLCCARECPHCTSSEEVTVPPPLKLLFFTSILLI